MNVLIVYAHDEPSSLAAAMKNLAVEVFRAKGHKITITDLYGIGFNPVGQKWDFVTTSGQHYNYMLEQKHAARLNSAYGPDILAEMQKITTAELILFVSPMWWLSVPAILKGWFDRVLAMGFAWDTGRVFETGLMHGKQAMMVMTAGGPAEYFRPEGRYHGVPSQLLHPINHGTLAFCGFNVHEPYVALNVLGLDQKGREKALTDFRYRLENMVNSPQWLIRY